MSDFIPSHSEPSGPGRPSPTPQPGARPGLDTGAGGLDRFIQDAARLLRDALRESPSLRQKARGLAEWLLAAAGTDSPAAAPPPPRPVEPRPMPRAAGPVPVAPAPAVIRGPVVPTPAQVTGPLQPVVLNIGGASRPVHVRGTSDEVDAARTASPPEPAAYRGPVPQATEPLPDLLVVAQRCRLKAESCRWAARRRRLIEDGASIESEIKPADADLVSRAKALPNCFLWTFDPTTEMPDDEGLEDLAGGYENLAAAALLTHDLWTSEDPDRTARDGAYQLLAEAQSAVRVAVFAATRRPDRDQDDTFRWLRTRTFEDRVLVGRHMRLDDPADITGWEDLRDRIAGLRRASSQVHDTRRQRKDLLGKARYTARLIAKSSSLDPDADWRKLAGHVDAVVALGVPPSDVELREILLPIAEQAPEGLDTDAGFGRALDEIDRYVAAREEAEDAPPANETRTISPQLREAAELLHGKVVLLIGGERRAQSAAALERALELKELRWFTTRAHQSIAGFEPWVARDDVALVMLAIRWSSHSFEGVRAMCERYDKPFVRLPRGYNANQVAAEIINQVSERLRRERALPAGK